MKKKIQKENFNKWIYVIFFGLALLFTTMFINNLDNDIWYLLSEGRYIVENGIYNIDPLSMHEGLEVVVQNWLSASLFWIVFDWFGEMGLFTLVLICTFFICLLLYKICMLISERNIILSLLLMLTTIVTQISHFIVSRPQVLSFVTLLSLIYVLELYIKTENRKYLIWIPIISFIQINMHASLWWMLFLFMLPYVIDSFNIPLLKTQGYKKKDLFIAIGIAALVGLINPYGYKAITFIFTSYGDQYMHSYINELLPFNFGNLLSKHMFILMLGIGLIYTFFREGLIRVRYICLFCGTLLLGFNSIKGFSHFILVSLFPLAYFFKDLFPKEFNDTSEMPKVINIILATISVFIIGGIVGFCVIKPEKIALTHSASEAIDTLELKFDKETTRIYSSFNDGGYVEFRGYKPYIDPRAELYLKVNNKKDDIFEEFFNLQHGLLDVTEFIEKYDFTHLLIASHDYLYDKITSDMNYFVIYEDTTAGYRLYSRNDLYSDKERNEIIKSYNEAIQNAMNQA